MALPSSGVMTLAMIQAEFGGANPIYLSEYYKGGAYVKATDAAPNVPSSGTIYLSNFHGASRNIVGQIEYTTPGTYTWVVPAGVTSVCVVCVGAGGKTGAYMEKYGSGGGSLAYGNSIPVTPGASYTVKVGVTAVNDYSTTMSFFGSESILRGGGGDGKWDWSTDGPAQPNAGAYLSGGGLGGNAGYLSGGGGGAGGYSGNGGQGGSGSSSPGGGYAGSGGGGGGGSGASSGSTAASGGGVGIYGQGANGAGGDYVGWPSTPGTGGSGGGNGVVVVGAYHGGTFGGGSGAYGDGGGGAVRIIWGAGRSFPSTNTGNL